MKNKTLSIGNMVSISLIVVINLLFLFYLKYSNHKLILADFRFNKIGNIINLSLSCLIILGLIIIYFRKTSVHLGFFYILTALLNLSLIFVVLINFLDIPSQEYYLLSLSFTQVLLIVAFSLFQLTQLFFLLVLWLKILKIEKLLYLRALVNSIFLSVSLLFFALILINTKPSNTQGMKSEENKLSVGVVLGAAVWSDNKPSPSLANRVDKAAELYKKGKVKRIQLTGGNAPGELSEAEVSLNYISKKGVRRSDVWIEKNTTSTIEQVRFIKNNLVLKKKMKSIVIISDIYHIKRAKEICRFYNIDVEIAPADLNLKTVNVIFYQIRECLALLLFWLFAL